MASADDASSPSDRRILRRLLCLKKDSDPDFPKPHDRNPLISSPPSPPPPRAEPKKKAGFASVAFRGLGCASSSSSQAFAPAAAAVRSSADWQGKRPSSRRRRAKQKKRERRSQAAVASDVWCAPGIGFAGDASVDCVVSHHQMAGRGGRQDGERNQRERPYSGRRGGSQERISSIMDSLSSIEAPLLESDLISPAHFHQLPGYHRSSDGLEEIMMFQTRVILGGMDVYDRYRDWRLDVDNMSYEELLELGERIGNVSTGLREEEILRSLRKMKHSIFDASPVSRISIEIERKCSICQEEYEFNDEFGKLDCGHGYHINCIKQWLLQKNACPVCKTAVTKT